MEYVGRSVARREDTRFLTGAATFVDDIDLPDAAHAAILRSTQPHARIRGIDATAALALPGVVTVLTYADFAHIAKPIPLRLAPIPGFEKYLQFALANEKVRFVGEPIAVIVAESRYIAEDALALVEIDYDPLPVVATAEAAIEERSVLHETTGSNVACDYTVANGDADAAFAEAPYTRREVFRCHRHAAVPLETRGFIAAYDGDRLKVWGSTKVLFFNRRILADLLEWPEERIEFVELDVGGGFGARGEFYPEDFLIPFAAVKLTRPVKWIEDRREHLTAANHSREITCELEIATELDGTLRGLRARLCADMGAYLRTNGGVVPVTAAPSLPGPYRLPAFSCTVQAVVTNKTPVGTYRAPGRYESAFFRERIFDMAAQDLGIDAVEFRMRNLLLESDLPVSIGKLIPYLPAWQYDIGDVPPLLSRALGELDMDAAMPAPEVMADGRIRAVGVACCIDWSGAGPSETARLVVGADGHVDVYVGVSAMGQGHQTVFAQIAADALGVPLDSVTAHRTGTSDLEWGMGTFNSRSIVQGGSAVVEVAAEVKARLVQAAGMRLNLAEDELEFRDGAIRRRDDPDGGAVMGFAEAVIARLALGLEDGDAGTLDVTAKFEQTRSTHTYGAHVGEIALDPETGGIEVLRYASVEDIGRCVNPMIVHGQSVGGTVQGIGGAILEEFLFDRDGQPLSATFADYMLPAATDVPSFKSVILENAPSKLNPLGVKGAGEGSIIAPGAVLANAVASALRPYGVEITDLPLRPDRIRELIGAARSAL